MISRRTPASVARQPYRQGSRALAAEATGRRIIDAFAALIALRRFDEITLDDVAAGAGVTRQTVIRRFGDKMGLMRSVGERIGEQVAANRYHRPAGNPAEAVARLVGDYEETGDLVISVLNQEDRSPELKEILNVGRAGHRLWVEESFGHFLAGLAADLRERRLIQLIAVTDVWVWRLLRRDQKRSAEEVEQLIAELVLTLIDRNKNKGELT